MGAETGHLLVDVMGRSRPRSRPDLWPVPAKNWDEGLSSRKITVGVGWTKSGQGFYTGMDMQSIKIKNRYWLGLEIKEKLKN